MLNSYTASKLIQCDFQTHIEILTIALGSKSSLTWNNLYLCSRVFVWKWFTIFTI